MKDPINFIFVALSSISVVLCVIKELTQSATEICIENHREEYFHSPTIDCNGCTTCPV